MSTVTPLTTGPEVTPKQVSAAAEAGGAPIAPITSAVAARSVFT